MQPLLDHFSPDSLPALLWTLLRTAPLAFAAPWLGWRGTAANTRILVAIVLTLAFFPTAVQYASPPHAGWLTILTLGAREVMLGLTYAIAVSIPIYALGWTGHLVETLRQNPDARRGMPTPLETLYLATGVVLFVGLGGHRVALQAFGRSFVTVPVGHVMPQASWEALSFGAIALTGNALELTLAFAAPLLLGLLLVEFGLAILSRIMPQLNAYFGGMPLRTAMGIGLAMLFLAVSLPHMQPLFAESIRNGISLYEELAL